MLDVFEYAIDSRTISYYHSTLTFVYNGTQTKLPDPILVFALKRAKRSHMHAEFVKFVLLLISKQKAGG